MTAWSTNDRLQVLDIKEGTIVDGPGLRTSIYLAGCRHACPGCHNPQSWDETGGQPMTVDEIMAVVSDNGFDVTITGGDPLMHIEQVLALARCIKSVGLNLWLFTGFTIEQIRASASLRRIIDAVDAIVEGPFVAEERDTSLRFRGSRNQRIIIHNQDMTDQFA